jgi:molybdopterin synthase sulfur carrier subunit
VNLLYFAWVRQKIGRSEEHFDLPAGIGTVRALAEHLRARDTAVSPDDEVAFFPPVTGG